MAYVEVGRAELEVVESAARAALEQMLPPLPPPSPLHDVAQSYSYSYSYSEYDSDASSHASGLWGDDLAPELSPSARVARAEMDAMYALLEERVLDTPNYLLTLSILRGLADFDGSDAHASASFWALVSAGSGYVASHAGSLSGLEDVVVEREARGGMVRARRVREGGRGEEEGERRAVRFAAINSVYPENIALRNKLVRHAALMDKQVVELEEDEAVAAREAAEAEERIRARRERAEGWGVEAAAWYALDVPHDVYARCLDHHNAVIGLARKILVARSQRVEDLKRKLDNILLELEGLV